MIEGKSILWYSNIAQQTYSLYYYLWGKMFDFWSTYLFNWIYLKINIWIYQNIYSLCCLLKYKPTISGGQTNDIKLVTKMGFWLLNNGYF